MWPFARSALRVYRASFIGSFLVVVLAAALLTATGVWLESGVRDDRAGSMLTAVASSFAGTTILVVLLVVASTFSAALRQRHTQFALLRAVGATTGQVRSMVTAEVVAVFTLAAPVGIVPGLAAAHFMTPLLVSGGIVPAGFSVSLSPAPVLGALALLFPTSLLAARMSARRIDRISPTAAVQASAAEPAELSATRRITAAALAATGLLAAGTPFVLPGTIGSATAATSAFLLISAAALAGPALVGWAARAAGRTQAGSTRGAALLAVANARGFSRRLTTAIIPLALFLALGTVQTGTDAAVVRAAELQLREGITADLVVTSPRGLTAQDVAAVGASSGVRAVVTDATVEAQVKTDDDEDLAFMDALSWESVGLRTLTGPVDEAIDPDVRSGSLADLASPGAVAVSSDALIGTGKKVGSTIELRFPDGTPMTAHVVAVYERGLGFGEYLVDAAALPAAQRPTNAGALFIALDGTNAAAARAIESQGLSVATGPAYAQAVGDSAASEQQLSGALILILVVFIAIAAANTLVMLTVARRREFALLRRVGATRRQIRAMVGRESLFVAGAALLIGTASVLPALMGVSYGLLGRVVPVVDWPVYGVLALAVAAVAVGSMGGAAWRASRSA